jgi:hypothetical protein
MNNIEILEELKARVKLYKKSTDVQFTFTKSDIEAIENLIKENKELKEKNKIYWKLYQDELNSKNDTWIEKTKITDLIEQLEDVLDLAEGEKNFPKYRKQALIEEIKDLQELLEEGE